MGTLKIKAYCTDFQNAREGIAEACTFQGVVVERAVLDAERG